MLSRKVEKLLIFPHLLSRTTCLTSGDGREYSTVCLMSSDNISTHTQVNMSRSKLRSASGVMQEGVICYTVVFFSRLVRFRPGWRAFYVHFSTIPNLTP